MKKWIVFSSLLSLLLLSSSCSWKPEKEIITKAEIYIPTINVVPRPDPLKLKNADIITTVSIPWCKRQGDFLNKNINFIPNGYSESVNQSHNNFKIDFDPNKKPSMIRTKSF